MKSISKENQPAIDTSSSARIDDDKIQEQFRSTKTFQDKQGALKSYHELLEEKLSAAINNDELLEISKYDSVAYIVWIATMAQASCLLRSLYGAGLKSIYNCQKPLYYQARFCIEAVSDLEYINNNRDEVEQFFGGRRNYKKALAIMRGSDLKKESIDKVVSGLAYVGRISSKTEERVNSAFPLYGPAYSALCLHVHLNSFGLFQELYFPQKAIDELMYACFDAISVSLNKLFKLSASTNIIKIEPKNVEEINNKAKEIYKFLKK